MKFDVYFDDADQTTQIAPGNLGCSFLGTDSYKKCLPFNIAGQLGWDIKLPHDYIVYWNGGEKPEDLKVISKTKEPQLFSKFGYGILTITIPYLFELEENTFLWIKGPTNNPLSTLLYPCEGVVEADWFPGQLAIDYKVLIKNTEIELKKDSPYCRILPYPKFYIEQFKPTYKDLNTAKRFNEKLSLYNLYDKFLAFSKFFLKSYNNGMLGTKKMNNVPKIKLTSPDKEKINKCPFHKVLN
jgi:hypothetical protein